MWLKMYQCFRNLSMVIQPRFSEDREIGDAFQAASLRMFHLTYLRGLPMLLIRVLNIMRILNYLHEFLSP